MTLKLPHDVVTHRRAWRDAILAMIGLADVNDEDDGANKSYWKHELAAFDRTFEALVKFDCTGDE